MNKEIKKSQQHQEISETKKVYNSLQEEIKKCLIYEQNEKRKEELQNLANAILDSLVQEKWPLKKILNNKEEIKLPNGQKILANSIISFLFLPEVIKNPLRYLKNLNDGGKNKADEERGKIKSYLERKININKSKEEVNKSKEEVNKSKEKNERITKLLQSESTLRQKLGTTFQPLDEQELAQRYGYSSIDALKNDYEKKTGKFKDSPLYQYGLDRKQVFSFLQTRAFLFDNSAVVNDPTVAKDATEFLRGYDKLKLPLPDIRKKEVVEKKPIAIQNLSNLSDTSAQTIINTGKGAGFEKLQIPTGQNITDITTKEVLTYSAITDEVGNKVLESAKKLTSEIHHLEVSIIATNNTLKPDDLLKLDALTKQIQDIREEFLPRIRASMPDVPEEFGDLSLQQKQQILIGIQNFITKNASNPQYQEVVKKLGWFLESYSERQKSYLDALGKNQEIKVTPETIETGQTKLAIVARNRAKIEAVKGFFGIVADSLSETISNGDLGYQITIKPDHITLDDQGNYECKAEFNGQEFTIRIEANGYVKLTNYGHIDTLNAVISKEEYSDTGIKLIGFDEFNNQAIQTVTTPSVLAECLTKAIASPESAKKIGNQGTLGAFDYFIQQKIKTEFEKNLVRQFNANIDVVHTSLAHEFQKAYAFQATRSLYTQALGHEATILNGGQEGKASDPATYETLKAIITSIDRNSINENTNLIEAIQGLTTMLTSPDVPPPARANDPVYAKLIAPIRNTSNVREKKQAFHNFLNIFISQDPNTPGRTFVADDLLHAYITTIGTGNTTAESVKAFKDYVAKSEDREKIENKEARSKIENFYKAETKEKLEEQENNEEKMNRERDITNPNQPQTKEALIRAEFIQETKTNPDEISFVRTDQKTGKVIEYTSYPDGFDAVATYIFRYILAAEQGKQPHLDDIKYYNRTLGTILVVHPPRAEQIQAILPKLGIHQDRLAPHILKSKDGMLYPAPSFFDNLAKLMKKNNIQPPEVNQEVYICSPQEMETYMPRYKRN